MWIAFLLAAPVLSACTSARSSSRPTDPAPDFPANPPVDLPAPNVRSSDTLTAPTVAPTPPVVAAPDSVAGAPSPGGSTPDGSTPGGSTPGGSTPGGSTPGGSTPGGFAGSPPPPAAARAQTPQVAVPAYFPPNPLWFTMLGTANTGSTHVAFAVMNPANGPGPSADPAYMSAIARARTRGVRVLGYVATGHGSRSTVLDDIAAYRTFYGLTDIFFDEASPDCHSLEGPYVQWIAAVRASGGFVVANPGLEPEECWAAAVDVIVTFEGTHSSYLSYRGPAWATSYPSGRFWHIVYGVPSGLVGSVAAIAERNGAGLYYATEDNLPNPFDSLPAELSVVTVPPPTTPQPSVPGAVHSPTTTPLATVYVTTTTGHVGYPFPSP